MAVDGRRLLVLIVGGDAPSETPTPGSKRRSRWDETPAGSQTPSATPIVGNTQTPVGQKAMVMQTPSQTGESINGSLTDLIG